MSAVLRGLRTRLWVLRMLVTSRMLVPMSPAKYVRLVRVLRRQGTHATTSFALAAVRDPHGTALVDERGPLTWQDLQDRSAALAAGLLDVAGGPVETVAILCRNHRGFVDALLASSRLGASALLLNTGFSGPQLADVMEREGARVILYDEEFAAVVADARARVPGLVEVLGWTEAPLADGVLGIEGLVARYAGQAPPRPARPGRIVLLTSGTTGTPKGARRSGGGADELAGMLEKIPWRGGETVVVAAPMFHAWGFGQLVIAATMTCTVVTRRRFDPEATLGLVDEHRASGLSVVPVMLERIMDLPARVLDRYRLSTLRFVSASGSRMRPQSVIAFMDRYGDVVHNSYNATEAGQISVAQPADLRHAPDTAGRPVRGTLLRVVDDAGRDVSVGEVGRILVRGVSPFDGYTAGAEKEFLDGAMVSGDVGRLDAEGRLYVVGRDDDMIVSGGENVYPIEVEKVLGAHPAVREVVVIGVDDAAFGQRLAAYVVLTGADAVSADELKAHVKAQLAGYKVPREVVVLDVLPRNATGKVMVRELPAAAS
ncbi:bile acid CoA ligase [Pimelobacter simplex]|uniref:AMP-binding protein n=1 Tax=Nocardioides simplex TaxID=2045 RepID=UPI000535F240|nr:AMP-binding protein [Pimelobacter simplex]MCG8152194.1 bile acid CoA ligase [Pimelobacter simplex]GEB12938.1 acyl-CoA synthetase [Pimelobacter simplex]SFM51953.1 fatty-acyl-CoA synthase [Pimelobacter simplex]